MLYSPFVWHYAYNALPYTNIIFRDSHLTAVCISLKKEHIRNYSHQVPSVPYPATPTGHKRTVHIQVENLTTTWCQKAPLYHTDIPTEGTHIKFLQFPYPATPTGHKHTVHIQVENLTTTWCQKAPLYHTDIPTEGTHIKFLQFPIQLHPLATNVQYTSRLRISRRHGVRRHHCTIQTFLPKALTSSSFSSLSTGHKRTVHIQVENLTMTWCQKAPLYHTDIPTEGTHIKFLQFPIQLHPLATNVQYTSRLRISR